MARRRGMGIALAVGLWLAALAVLPGPASAQSFTRDFNFEDCDGFSTTGTNPFFIPLKVGNRLAFRGEEDGESVTLLIEILNKTVNIDGVNTRVMRETERADGKLVEISENFLAICNRDNSITYHGEDVDIYDDEGEKVVSHEGAWRAGDDGAKPGILMPGTVLLGARYFQELAPGVALDRAEHLSLTQTVSTFKGTFKNALKVRETTPLESGVSIKFYARGTGLIRDGVLKLAGTNF